MSTLSPATVRSSTAGISLAPRTESFIDTVHKLSELAGRILLSVLFLISGLGKITAYAGTAAYMSSLGVPGALLPVAIATEVLGSARDHHRLADPHRGLPTGWLLAAHGADLPRELRRPGRNGHVPQERLDRRRLAVAGRERRRALESRFAQGGAPMTSEAAARHRSARHALGGRMASGRQHT